MTEETLHSMTAAAVGTVELPVQDLTAPNADRDLIEKELEYGFLAVVRHGFDPDLLRASLDVMRDVGRLPPQVLMQYHHARQPETMSRSGYFTYGEEKAKDFNGGWDLKHFWHIYRDGHATPTMFPREVPRFEPVMRAYFAAWDMLQYRVACAFTRYSGIELPVPMEQAMFRGDTIVRGIHYPNVGQMHELARYLYSIGRLPSMPTEAELRGIANTAMRATPHEDINFTTGLQAVDGLEIKTREGKWVAVVAPPDSLIVQTGDMKQAASFGDFISATHRVVNTDDPDAERVNNPCFGHPRPEVPLVTKKTFKERMRNGKISMGVHRQMEVLGLEARLRDPSCEVLVGAGEYLMLRLREIGIIKDD